MKIAFVSDNGSTISRHFGRARQYVVIHVEQGREVAREHRPKGSCHGHHHASSDAQHADHGHHHDHSAEEDMLAVVADCDAVIAGGMGAGMDQRLRAAGLRTVRTRMQEIDLALKAFLTGSLGDDIALVHATH